MEDEVLSELRIEGREFLRGPVWTHLFKPAIEARIRDVSHLITHNKRMSVDTLRDHQGQLTILEELRETPKVLFGLDDR